MEINEFNRRYESWDRKKCRQKLDKRIFNGHPMVNSAKRYPHLAIGQHIYIPRRSGSLCDDLERPADVEVSKQVVNIPLMVAVDNTP